MSIFRRPQAGTSLVSVMVVVAIVGVVAAVVSKLMHHAEASSVHTALRSDLETVKTVVRARLDCAATLGVPANAPRPVACPATPLVARRAGGQAIETGTWTLNTTCLAGQHLVVGATRPGKDPLNDVAWASLKVRGYAVATDLFSGTADFCREWLDPAYVPSPSAATCGPNEVMTGIDFDTKKITCQKQKFGGSYVVYGGGPYDASAKTGCIIANPVTGACACPAGYAVKGAAIAYSVEDHLNLGGGFGCTAKWSLGQSCTWELNTCVAP
jgi:hypothetical protein